MTELELLRRRAAYTEASADMTFAHAGKTYHLDHVHESNGVIWVQTHSVVDGQRIGRTWKLVEA